MNKPNPEFDSLLPPLVLSRRGFLTTSVMSGFAVAAGPVMAQTAIKTDDKGLVAGQVQIPVAGGSVPAYRAAPAGKTHLPVILVVQEIFGVHEYIQDVCRRLAKLGYLAIATDCYSRQGNPADYKEMAKLYSEVVNKVPDAQVMSDLDATVKWAAANGGNTNRLGITGFCWGGRITWLYSAHNPKVKAGVAWYGRLINDKDAMRPTQAVDLAAKINGPVLGLYGGEDAGIPVTTINTMKAALEKGSKAAQASEFVLYSKAPHAFHADYRPSYREAEAKDGWSKMQAWFKKYL
jgi:carboxymethylenebutenolidase